MYQRRWLIKLYNFFFNFNVTICLDYFSFFFFCFQLLLEKKTFFNSFIVTYTRRLLDNVNHCQLGRKDAFEIWWLLLEINSERNTSVKWDNCTQDSLQNFISVHLSLLSISPLFFYFFFICTFNPSVRFSSYIHFSSFSFSLLSTLAFLFFPSNPSAISSLSASCFFFSSYLLSILYTRFSIPPQFHRRIFEKRRDSVTI